MGLLREEPKNIYLRNYFGMCSVILMGKHFMFIGACITLIVE